MLKLKTGCGEYAFPYLRMHIVLESESESEADPVTLWRTVWFLDVEVPTCLDLGSPNFFSLRATLTPPLSPKGQDLASLISLCELPMYVTYCKFLG
jgi:hypothetical protein